MFHQQNGASSSSSWSEIELFRMKNRMQARQQVFPNMMLARSAAPQENGGDERRRKISAGRLQFQPSAHVLATCASHEQPGSTSPVPHRAQFAFNAFDFTASPEGFSSAASYESNQIAHHELLLQADHCNQADEHETEQDSMAMDGHEDEEDLGGDAKSLWRRRFADDRWHQKRSPKLGQCALWQSFPVMRDNQLGHHFANDQAAAAAYMSARSNSVVHMDA